MFWWLPLYILLVQIVCQRTVVSQRIDKLTCARRPTHTRALKIPGDNGFSIKIVGSPPIEYYEPGHDYTIVLNGSFTNQQFLDFMLVATLKQADSERRMAGSFVHLLSHMTKADENCNHIMTSITFHPSYKKSAARFLWTAPRKGSGCVIFKATVVELSDIWFSDDGGLTKMFCEKPEEEVPTDVQEVQEGVSNDAHQQATNSHSKRQSGKCCACDVAKYELTFVGNWSRETHPKNFPDAQHESLLHWSDIIGASHSPSYSIWSYGKRATAGVKEVCEYGWPRTLEGEIKQQSRNVRTVIKTSGIWGYPAIYTTKRSARFSTDNSRPFMSLLTMVGPSPDWCIGVDSLNMCLENCTWLDSVDLELYPWDAGTDSGVTYLSNNLPSFPKENIRPITNKYPNNTASPFYGDENIKPLATVRVRRVGGRGASEPNERCEANNGDQGSEEEEEEQSGFGDIKCMVTEWSEYTVCSVTCGVGVKTRTRQFKHPMGTLKACPHLKLQESDSCLGLVNVCDNDPNEPVDVCITSPWSNWSPCSVSCGPGSRVRTRQYLSQMGQLKCSQSLMDSDECTGDIADCSMVKMDWASVCQLDAEPGKCSGNFTRFFYDVNMGKCRPFTYGGCRGNQNRFESQGECEKACTAVMRDIDSTDLGTAVDAADIDCMVTEWTDFSECTVSCGTGLRSRSRMIKVRNSGNGAACPKDLNESVVCASECPPVSANLDIDCMMSEWNTWSTCSVTCEDGVQARDRMVKRPAQGQGQPCPAERKEMKECNMGSCVEPAYPLCMLSEWGPYSDCSVSCGTGKKMRRRMMKRGPCPDDTFYTEIEICQGTQCGGLTPQDCTISEWSPWTECDVSCGDMGTQTRTRAVLQAAINGGRCEFEGPKEMEKRACYNGACPVEVTDASVLDAPVDCMVDAWADWTTCSKSCGIGKQIRRRKIKRKRKNEGERCPSLKETRSCDTGYKCRRRRNRRL